ncbi:hypothetical protein N658DRAFT_516945 [Parathielavia hyrcaniae]|uniref:ferric-chelate reductase (NADPH) n=1 Tax=Parathielavia hyrcaniae TaxID=113614 RepID=A0AAN6Q332_9PEZI|nr:hypothetical protein N658DRAFT_516945 [Parathielavia hyrcaniae]
MAAYFAHRQVVTERMMEYYAAGICGLVALFVVLYWTRWLWARREGSHRTVGRLGLPFVACSRLLRNLLIRKVPGFKSAGHAIVVTAYVAINAAITFTNVPGNPLSSLAHRFGWISLVNMVLVVFLALKNTPLAFLTAYSYERLNCLHQIAGYTVFAAMAFHAALYTAFFSSQGRLHTVYADSGQIAAIVASFAFLSIIFSAVFLRRLRYELFYVTHISSWVVAVVAVGFHQPEFTHKALIVTLIAASMWFGDRIVRASRILYYSLNNEATLHSLPEGGTKVVMKKVPARAEPGKHCFVWIPAIRKFETHPFTIHRSSPVEFTVKAQNGFTSDLHKYAAAHPGATVRASIDGPYGTFPDPVDFDKVVLIAGGGGATFTFGLAVNALERMDQDSPKDIAFIWVVKKHENLSWFREQLDLLRTHPHSPRVNISLYVTRTSSSGSGLPPANRYAELSSEATDSPPLSPVGPDPGKNLKDAITDNTTNAATTDASVATTTRTFEEHPIKAGRPDVASLIRAAVWATPRDRRVLVAACGPDGLMRVVRDTTARLIVGDGPAVELHCEQFGW